MKLKSVRYLVGDFETTVYKGQTYTEVWASAIVEMYTENVFIHHSIGETFEYLCSLKQDLIVYYHNLKFDGSFWISYLLYDLHFTQAFSQLSEAEYNVTAMKNCEMPDRSFKYSISDLGQWYTITIQVDKHTIELRDSFKLLPFSVARIGESFQTKHKKLEMEYEGVRYAGCPITDKEKEYIANDVLVVKEALEIMFNEGHKKLTIGSCCLAEFESTYDKWDYAHIFPSMTDIALDPELMGASNADEYIRKSYKGGWCYVVKGKEGKMFTNGLTADVNSLYPSMMSSESKNKFPVGTPKFWSGNYIPPQALDPYSYYFIRIRTRFYIKSGYLPCIQIKGNLLYRSTEWLETSDILNRTDGKYYPYYVDQTGTVQPALVTLTLTMTDYELIKEHYHLVDTTILDGCVFRAEVGIFDDYIEKYKQMKLTSKGARRELAKLFLNNLYGKMASSENSSFKYAITKPDGSVGFVDVTEFNKKAGYIPCGTAITSYARNFTIRSAQKNYHGVNARGFIYADTDSIHCDLSPTELIDIPVHPKDFCHWKVESCWDVGYFVRQKTYIEHITHEDLEPISQPYHSIKCAGMPTRCKQLLEESFECMTEEEWKTYRTDEWNKMTDEEKAFVTIPRSYKDFTYGLCVPSKLMPKRIKGGTLLVPTTYQMR